MTSALRLAAAVLALAVPSVASAALALRIGPNTGPNGVDATFDPPFPAGTQYLELFFVETGPTEVQSLSTYDIGVTLRPADPANSRIRIVQPTTLAQRNALATPSDPAAHPFVFEGASVTVTAPPAGQESTRIQINFDNLGEPADIVDGMSAGRIPFVIEGGPPYGRYLFGLDPDNTVFASSEALPIAVNITDDGVISYVPEPSAASVLVPLGLLARRRRAGRRAVA